MQICVTNIMKFNSNFKHKGKIKEFADVLGLSKEEIELYFTLYLTSIIKQRVINSIKYQKINGLPMAKVYEPLSDRYAKSKPKKNQQKFYRNTEWLYHNIKSYKYKGKFYIGFAKNTKHPSNGAKAVDILAWNEKGTKHIPARPLVTPHMTFVLKRLKDYWNYFTKLMMK